MGLTPEIKAPTELITLAFLGPGFVMNGIIDLFSPPQKREAVDAVLRLLTFSFINAAVWSWLAIPIIYLPADAFSPFDYVKTFVWIAFAGPVLLGILSGLFVRANWCGKLLQKIGLSSMHPLGPWHFCFTKLTEKMYVLVTLKGGKEIRGLFSDMSMAASDDRGDLFIEQLMANGDSGWTCEPATAGIWIRGDEILTVEFITGSKKEQEDGDE